MSLFQILKRKAKQYSSESYYRNHDIEQKKIADKAISNLLKTLPSHRLSGGLEKKIEEYAQERLGSVWYAPMLKAYAVYQGEFKEGLIPDNYFYRYVLPRANGFHRGISDLRPLAKRILQSEEMPDLGYYMNGCWTTSDYQPIDRVKVKDYLFSTCPQIIIKLNSSMRGQGFFRMGPEEFERTDFSKFTDFVVQRPIEQADWYARFEVASVATLRITTVKPFGQKAKKRAAFMRFGTKGADRVTAESRMVIGVHTSGCLDMYSMDSDWNLLDRHPDSGLKWEGECIPDFELMVKRCETLHDQVGIMEIIGWDVVMDAYGKMQLMEWNTGYPGIVHNEMSTGPNFVELGWDALWKS